MTLNPGKYTSITVTSGTVTLNPGLYILTGTAGSTSLTMTGGTLSGTGVTLYIKGGVSETGSARMNLTAPTTGQYNGVLFFEGDNAGMAFTMASGTTFQGIVYAPQSSVAVTGSSVTISSDFIVGSLGVTGLTLTDTNYAVTTNPNSVLGKLGLVE